MGATSNLVRTEALTAAFSGTHFLIFLYDFLTVFMGAGEQVTESFLTVLFSVKDFFAAVTDLSETVFELGCNVFDDSVSFCTFKIPFDFDLVLASSL